MNPQQYAVFLKHLLETDSIPGVKGTETITLWDAVGWLPAPQHARRDRASLILHSYSPLLPCKSTAPAPSLSTQVISPWSGSAESLLHPGPEEAASPPQLSPLHWALRTGLCVKGGPAPPWISFLPESSLKIGDQMK